VPSMRLYTITRAARIATKLAFTAALKKSGEKKCTSGGIYVRPGHGCFERVGAWQQHKYARFFLQQHSLIQQHMYTCLRRGAAHFAGNLMATPQVLCSHTHRGL